MAYNSKNHLDKTLVKAFQDAIDNKNIDAIKELAARDDTANKIGYFRYTPGDVINSHIMRTTPAQYAQQVAFLHPNDWERRDIAGYLNIVSPEPKRYPKSYERPPITREEGAARYGAYLHYKPG